MKKDTVLYIHGALSGFDKNSKKVRELEKQFEVIGFEYTMEEAFDSILSRLTDKTLDIDIDCIIGTSLGGLLASHLSSITNIPAVVINPSVNPKETLVKLLGVNLNFASGKDEVVTTEIINTYKTFCPSENIMLYLGMNDKIINPLDTARAIGIYCFDVSIDDSANHRWESFSKNSEIQKFINIKSTALFEDN